MKIKVLFPVIFFIFCFSVLSQSKSDSIQALIIKAKDFSHSDIDSTSVLINLAYDLSVKENDINLISDVIYYKSYYLLQQQKYKKAISVLNFNLENSDLIDVQVLGKSFYVLGSAYYLQEIYDEALGYYLQTINYYELVNDRRGLAKTNLQIGVIYEKLGKMEMANYFYDSSLLYSSNAKNNHGKSELPINIPSEVKIEMSKKMLEELDGKEESITESFIRYNLGVSFKNIGDCQNSIENFEASLKIKKLLNYNINVGKTFMLIADCYFELGKNTAAIFYLDKARKQTTSRKQVQEIEFLNYKILLEKKDYKSALKSFKVYVSLKDSINYLKENERIAEITAQYETEKQAKEIEILSSDNKLKSSQLSNQKTIFFSIVLGLLLLTAAVYFAYKRYKTKQKLEFSEVTRKLLQMQLNPHFLFNALNGIQYFIKKNDTKKSAKYIQNFSGLMRNILENSIEKFIPIKEDFETIKDYLALQQLVNNNSFKFEIQIEGQIDVANLCIPPMFIQPFVENAVIHGIQGLKGGSIFVNYKMNLDKIIVSIGDNGEGINENNDNINSLHKSMGTSITRQRIVNLLKTENYPVEIKVESKNENNTDIGTLVTLSFPLKYL